MNIHAVKTTPTIQENGNPAGEIMPKSYQGFLRKYFIPREVDQAMTQEARGIFIPYPLLAALILVGGAVLSFVVAVQVQVSNLNQQVSNLNTTILMRDTDARAQIHDLKEENAQMKVYIQNDREQLAVIKTKLGIGRN